MLIFFDLCVLVCAFVKSVYLLLCCGVVGMNLGFYNFITSVLELISTRSDLISGTLFSLNSEQLSTELKGSS